MSWRVPGTQWACKRCYGQGGETVASNVEPQLVLRKLTLKLVTVLKSWNGIVSLKVYYVSGKVMMELIITPLPLLLKTVEIFLLIAQHLFFNIGMFYTMSFVLTEYLNITSIPTFKILRPDLGMDPAFIGLGAYVIWGFLFKKRNTDLKYRKSGIVLWKDLWKRRALKLRFHLSSW